MSLWSTVGFFKKLVTDIRNWRTVQTSYMHQVGSIHCVGLAICICFIFVRPHFDIRTTTGDSVPTRIAMQIATPIVSCSFCPYIGASCNNNVVTWDSVHLPSIATGDECSGTILLSKRNMLGMPCLHTSFLVKHWQPCFGKLRTKFEPTGPSLIRRMVFSRKY